MRVELLTCAECAPCGDAIAVWREACAENDLELVVLAAEEPEGEQRIAALGLRVLPAILFDGELVAVGVQTLTEARHLLTAGPPREDPGAG